MGNKLFFVVMGIILINLVMVSANIVIEKNEKENIIISELKNPAFYELTIKNLGVGDIFEVYSLAGVNMDAGGNFSLNNSEEKTIRVKATATEEILRKDGIFVFIFKIKGETSGIQEDFLTLRIHQLNNSLEFGAYNVEADSDKAKVYVRNKLDYDFPEIKARFYSSLYDSEKTFSLASEEKKDMDIEIDKEKIKKLIAGSYIFHVDYEAGGIKRSAESNFRFLEKSNIETRESKEGFIVVKKTIEKINVGNTPAMAEININKNIISRLFTTFSLEPLKVERIGFLVTYTFQKELKPSESFIIKATTNWTYPLFLVIVIIITAILVSIYTTTIVVLNKKSTFVRIKSGKGFALKITLRVKARKYVEKVSVIDKLPAMFKLYGRFGAEEPKRFDEKNRRLQWDIQSLEQGEERIFSYIIFSDVSVVGKFELPIATAVYEREGRIHETESNRVYFLTEVRKRPE